MQNEKFEYELKPCPLCGEVAELRRVFKGCTNKSTITDEWAVFCENGCCYTRRFSDEIYHADNGAIIIAHNGAIEAVEAWNKRV